MKKCFIITFAIVSIHCFGQKAEIIKLDKLQKIINARSDQVQVINFWATWCGPCVKELPFFEKLNSEGRKDIKITLISMDMDLDSNPEKVYKFIERKKIQSQVLLLDEKNPDAWISSIEKDWSGALPATIVINQKTGSRKFVGKALHEGDLEKLINEVQ